jgi:hypothetical protein
MTVFTKEEIAEIALRPIPRSEKIKSKCIESLVKKPNWKFKKVVEQSTKLKIKHFGNNKFYFDYN